VTLACGLELIVLAKVGALLLGALGITGAVAKAQEEEPCSDDC
jgi:hypothetical protein